jgi:hypothetical protein
MHITHFGGLLQGENQLCWKLSELKSTQTPLDYIQFIWLLKRKLKTMQIARKIAALLRIHAVYSILLAASSRKRDAVSNLIYV